MRRTSSSKVCPSVRHCIQNETLLVLSKHVPKAGTDKFGTLCRTDATAARPSHSSNLFRRACTKAPRCPIWLPLSVYCIVGVHSSRQKFRGSSLKYCPLPTLIKTSRRSRWIMPSEVFPIHQERYRTCLWNSSCQNSLQMNLMTSRSSPSRGRLAVYRSTSCLPTLKPVAKIVCCLRIQPHGG